MAAHTDGYLWPGKAGNPENRVLACSVRPAADGLAEGFRPADGVLLFEDPATTSKSSR